MNIQNLTDDEKKQLLRNKEFIEKNNLKEYEIRNIINSLSDIPKTEILLDDDLILNNLKLSKVKIIELAKTLSSEEAKEVILEMYKIENFSRVDIINTFSVESKFKIVLEENKLNDYDKMKVLDSLNIDDFKNFFIKNKEECLKRGIHPYEIIKKASAKKQREIFEDLEDFNFTLTEKREVLVIFKKEVKESINTIRLPKEYKSAIAIKTNIYGTKIEWDPNRDAEDYQGLDNLLKINPENFSKREKEKFIKLCDICPNLTVVNVLKEIFEVYSTAKEYKEAEAWIEKVLEKIKPEYSDVQKIAIIDNAIGKRIGYSPDIETEVYSNNDSRALWKIISSGYGVCNGIARVEQYIFDKVGIESEIVSCKIHAFLKIKNIEIPSENGKIIKGNTILDPTWNLASHKFDGMPSNFLVNYDKARKKDIDSEGNDHKCHKNDEKLSDATLQLNSKELRIIFASVGLTDEEGRFFVNKIIEKSKIIDAQYAKEPNENINKQLILLQNEYPEFAKFINETTSILKEVFLNKKNLKLNRCVINRVFEKTDKFKKPVLYIYINSDEIGEKFYYADRTKKQFIELEQEEFEKQFECYQEDLKKSNGIKPWKKENIKKLETSSGTIIAEEEIEK